MITTLIHQLDTDETGATMVEYGLLIVLVALGVLIVLSTLGPTVAGLFGDANLMDAL